MKTRLPLFLLLSLLATMTLVSCAGSGTDYRTGRTGGISSWERSRR